MNKKKKLRVLSGIQPSGSLHLGNYFGMMSRMIDHQENNELFCFIADYHALTSTPKADVLSSNIFNAACDFLALGLDHEKTNFWIQSDVPAVTELAWILASQTNIGLMERSTSYKDKLSKGIKPNMGLYSYPILMAADILLFNTELVPVGKDQKQHLEITRDIANRFNHTFGKTFTIPTPDIKSETQLIPGIDGQKMSKSYKNTIPIFGSEKIIRKKIMSIITDNASVDLPKNKNSTLFELYCLFLNLEEKENLINRYDGRGLRYGDIKIELYDRVMDYFSPYRQKREQFFSRPDDVFDILSLGAKKVNIIALETIEKVRLVTGLSHTI